MQQIIGEAGGYQQPAEEILQFKAQNYTPLASLPRY